MVEQPSSSAKIAVEAIDFAYPNRPPIFEGFSWHAQRGDVWTVLGPSGSGKSTFLLLLAGLLVPQSGSIAIDDVPLTRPRPGTSFILQEYGLLNWATLRENATLGLRIQRFYGPDGRHAPRGDRLSHHEISRRAAYWLGRLDIEAVADHYPGQVSGGQRQRAAIARALVLNPDLLLMDEPFAALDAPTREDLQRVTLDLCAEAGLTVVLVTHSIEEAAFVGQRILVLPGSANANAMIRENPHIADTAYRTTDGYRTMCASLREHLGVT